MTQNKTALITGISGRIGSNLASVLLERNINVVGLDYKDPKELNQKIHFIKHDVNKISEKKKFMTIFLSGMKA